MIITAEKAKELIDLDGWTDAKIEMKLKAIEQTIRAYTNNNFQKRACRCTADIIGGVFAVSTNPFSIGDTIQISEPSKNAGLYVVSEVGAESFCVSDPVDDEGDVLATKIEYPADVLACAVNLLEWEATRRGKVGIQSETLSRHSVTYFSMDGNNSLMGYPVSLLGCLRAYRKARC